MAQKSYDERIAEINKKQEQLKAQEKAIKRSSNTSKI